MNLASRCRQILEAGPIRGLAAAVAVIAVWELLVAITNQPSAVFPPPDTVARTLQALAADGFSNADLSSHIGRSLARVALGLLASLAVGVPIGFLMGRSTLLRRALTPFITLFRPIPPFAFLAILIVWFGIGETSKVLVIFLGCVTIVALSTLDGVLRMPAEYREAALTLGANRRQVFLRVVMPGTLPQILNGTRVALAVAWTALIAAEWVGTQEGVGAIILQSSKFLRTDQALAGIVILGIFGALTDRLIVLLQHVSTDWASR